MSVDTARESISIVDSSLTRGKDNSGNSDDPDSSGYKATEDSCPSGTDLQLHSCNPVENISASGNFSTMRYFIIKSLNHQNIQLSVEKGIWATQVMNEPILDEAFHVRRLVNTMTM